MEATMVYAVLQSLIMVLVNTADDHNFLLNNVTLIYYCPYKGHLNLYQANGSPPP